jgi:hypothetical protein
MAFSPGQAALLRPATVPVHNDRHMSGQTISVTLLKRLDLLYDF